MTKIHAVIFDMDGVVINSEPLGLRANTELFKQLGLDVPESVYATFVGSAPTDNLRKLKQLYTIPLEYPELIKFRSKIYFDLFDKAEDLQLMPGFIDFITYLKDNGIVTILATSSFREKIKRVFDKFPMLASCFDDVVSGEDFEFTKPDPAIFIEAVKRTGFDKSECIIIEDSTNGIKAAKAAGVYCVAYKTGHGVTQDMTNADKIITDFRQLSPLTPEGGTAKWNSPFGG
ncbi:HAD family hydrolase [Flavobacterium sp. RHBU_24]|uniref:HAD family hydrolase n=1 Tax=Flavobacterium sp. RHBU_24 TaxID=3391185 RepID=UPI0039848BD0